MDARRLRDAALEAANRGWSVIPLRPKQKQPATRHGLLDARDDLVGVFQYWEQVPEANVGVVCHASDLVVIDVDPRHDGDETLYRAEKALGPLPTTVSALTGGGGAHYFFNHPGGTLRGQIGPGVDVKDHGYVLISPSIHPSGERYEWDNDPDDVEVVDLPPRWVDALQVTTQRSRNHASSATLDPLRHIPAVEYVERITGRKPNRDGYIQCPFHGGGKERTPSLKPDSVVWSCWGCPPPPGMRCMGGNIYNFMALYRGLAIPPRGTDYLIVKDELERIFGASL